MTTRRDQLAQFYEEIKRTLSVAGDLIMLNILFVLCSIPVITAGAAAVACYTGILRTLRGEDAGVSIAGYFRDFAAALKKATPVWLIELACLLVLAGDYWYAVVYCQPANTFFLIFAIVLAAVVLLAAAWVYPLIARYENKVGAHIKNAGLLALAHFPKTVLALLIQAVIVIIPLLFFDVFVYLGWFWLMFGASLPMYLTARLFRRTLSCEPAKTDTDDKS